MIFAYLTCANRKEAERISKLLLEKRLCACTNFSPINSMYWWKGKIEKAKEFAVIAKTTREKYARLEREAKKIHSYKVPFIGLIEVKKVEKNYLKWLEKEID